MITEYRQTGRDANGDNIVGTGGDGDDVLVGMGWGWVQNILPCHSSSVCGERFINC